MLTRRTVLTGTAAASIAAIASAHGVAAAGPNSAGFDFGNLVDGALGAFHKIDRGFGVFVKWETSRAEVFYKESPNGGVEVFLKSFVKEWTPVETFFLKVVTSLDTAAGAFHKVSPDSAEFFIKAENGIHVVTTFETDPQGVQIFVTEIPPTAT